MKHAALQRRSSEAVARTPEQSSPIFRAHHDALEDEAERAADLALALPEHAPSLRVAHQLRPAASVTSQVEKFPSSVAHTLAESGAPLENGLRADMERRFGHDFSHVRVHADQAAAQSAREVSAQAYTAGHHVVFGRGAFAPHSQEGRRLIAHELAHVVQQSRGGSGGTTPRALQRRSVPEMAPPTVNFGQSEDVNAAPATDLLSLKSDREGLSTAVDVQTHASRANAAPGRTPQAESAASAPPQTTGEVPTDRPRRVVQAARPATPGDASPPIGPDTQQDGESSLPHLESLIAPRQPAAAGPEPRATSPVSQEQGISHRITARPEDVDVVGLLGALVSGASTARKTIHGQAIAARNGINRKATWWSKRLEVQTKAADDAVRATAQKRHAQIDTTIIAHRTEIDWLERQCKEDAGTYAKNAKAAHTDGFGFYREQLAKLFDDWSGSFDDLKKAQSDRLVNLVEANISRMWDVCENYNRQYIKGIPNQSEARREVQRDAAGQVVDKYAEAFRKTKTEILPELAKACEDVKAELAKNRNEALTQYDKGLPAVLTGIDEQLAEAIPDIGAKAQAARKKLDKAEADMHAGVKRLEKAALDENADVRAKVERQLASGRDDAEKQFQRAERTALEPIVTFVDEAVRMLMATDEELDPAGSQALVDEVVQFTLAGADATAEVFAEAHDRGAGALAKAAGSAKRGFAIVKADVEKKLHDEGVDDELKLVDFSVDTEKHVRLTLTDLDATFKTGVEEAGNKLTSMVGEARLQMREPMENAQAEIRKAVNLTISKQAAVYWGLPKDIHKAAREAAWRYDHPYLKRVRDVVEFLGDVLVTALGFVLIVGILIGVAFIAVMLFGELFVAFAGGFLIGYFGAKAYQERRDKNPDESRWVSFFGAVGDVTGFNDARRAFTDPDMTPFERGVAWGGFWLGLFGAAAGASRFLKAIKVKLPEGFTNPFRFKGATLPEAASEGRKIGFKLPHQDLVPDVAGGTPPKPRKIGFELPHQAPEVPDVSATTPKDPGKAGFELPHQAPEVPASAEAPATKPGKVGFELPYQEAEVPKPPTPKPERAGFRLPHEEVPAPETPGATAPKEPVTPKLHHRKPTIPEAAPRPKRRIGFGSSEEAVAPVEAPSGAHEQPTPGGGQQAGSVISDMPRARQMTSPPRRATGSHVPAERPSAVRASATPEAPGAKVGEAPVAEGPVKGSTVSTVEPEAPAGAPKREKLPPDAERRLADEEAVQRAHEKRVADEERVRKLREEIKELDDWKKELRKALGRKRKRDYVDERFDQAKRELNAAESDLRTSRRAEAEAEIAERTNARPQRDVDPAAARHDPKVKEDALNEYKRRQARVEENDAVIKANEEDLARAKAKVAEREREFDATRPGNEEGPQGRQLAEQRDAARKRLESARRRLEAVQERTRPAYEANQKHYERMQELYRVMHPEEFPELSKAKGDFGERQAHNAMGDAGYDFKGSSKEPANPNTKSSEQGLDGVYEKTAPTGKEPAHVVGEAKYGTADLRPGQEKWEWVDERLDRTVGRDHANRMRREGYEYWVMKYDPKTRTVRPMKLWRFEWNQKLGPGGVPLGNPHYFPPNTPAF